MGLGGFSLSAHHGYNPATKTLFYGDGRRRRVANEQAVLDTVAGTGIGGYAAGDGNPATEATLQDPRGVAVAPDGSIYISGGHRIRRVNPDGIIETIAGTSSWGYNGDGIPAVSAQLSYFTPDIALAPDGSIYVSDSLNYRIRRIDPLDHKIYTVAGTGVNGSSGDGGPATSAQVGQAFGIDVGPGGEVYFVEAAPPSGGSSRVRVIYPDGTIDTVAGGGTRNGAAGVGHDPREHYFIGGKGLVVAPDSTVYYASDTTGSRVYRFRPGGPLESYVGTSGTGYAADGTPRAAAPLTQPEGLALGADGSLYIAVGWVAGPVGTKRAGVQRVSPDGIVTTVAGTFDPFCTSSVFCGEGGPATAAAMLAPRGVAIGPDGSLFTADSSATRVLRVKSGLPAAGAGNIVIPSEDASALYVFDGQGRHLETRDAALGNKLLSFAYSPEGLLVGVTEHVTDIDSRTTTLVHDELSLELERIVGPFGHETDILTDVDRYIELIANPLDEAFTMTYHPGGLIDTFTDPRGHTSSYTFDAKGNLTLAEKPASTGGWQSFDRADVPEAAPSSRLVTRTTALGRTTRYTIEEHDNDDETWTVEGPDGLAAETLLGNDGTDTTTHADGTVITVTRGPDPRYGMLAPVTESVVVETGAHTLTTTSAREVTLTNEFDPLSIETLTDTVTINGRSFSTELDRTGPAPVVTTTSAAGRITVTDLDLQGRPTRTAVTGLVGGTTALVDTVMEYDDGSVNPLHAGLLKSVTRGTSPDERRYAFVYDAAGNLERIDAPLGKTVSFGYDGATRVTSKTFPDGEQVRFFYDAAGNLEKLAQPGSPLSFLPEDVHQLDSEERNFLEALHRSRHRSREPYHPLQLLGRRRARAGHPRGCAHRRSRL